ncbi:MAG: hypothetical protein EBX50_01460 [Chitinophagia bacterium]|jgi:hypothetical protein|nr:hypothetical protein [Chitinophagia bacterium]
MDNLSNRVIFVRLSLSTGETVEIENTLHMDVKIKKTTSAAGNEADISIYNLNQSVCNAIVEASGKIYSKRTDKKTCSVQVSVGYNDTEMLDIFFGDVVTAEVTGLTDRMLNIKAQTGFYKQLKLVSKSFDQLKTKASTICKTIADDMGVELKFEATEKEIYRYSYAGIITDQLRNLLFDYSISCFVDDKTLIAKDVGKQVQYDLKVVDADSQMIGIPKLTEHGVDVITLFDPGFKLGGKISLTSIKNPSANGEYIVHQIQYDLSNYGNSFYMNMITAEPKEKKQGKRKAKKND